MRSPMESTGRDTLAILAVLIATVLMAAPGQTRAQDIAAVEYFIDSDPGPGFGVPVSVGGSGTEITTTMSVAVAGLAPGLHVIGVRTRDDDGSWGVPETRTFRVLPDEMAAPITPVSALEYYIDTDPGPGFGTDMSVGAPAETQEVSAQVSLAGLAPGLHRLTVRTRGSDGTWGVPETRTLRVMPDVAVAPVAPVAALEYYLGADPGPGLGTVLDVGAPASEQELTAILPAAGLPPGLHRMTTRAQDGNGTWGVPETRTFRVMAAVPQASPAPLASLEYYIDADPGPGLASAIDMAGPVDEHDLTTELTALGLDPGLHELSVRARDVDGRWGIPETRNFRIMEIPAVTSPHLAGLEFFIDDDPGLGEGTAIAVPADADTFSISFEVPVTGELDPLWRNRFSVRALDNSGNWGPIDSRMFRYAVPKLISVSPGVGGAGGSVLITLGGDGLIGLQSVSLNGPSSLSPVSAVQSNEEGTEAYARFDLTTATPGEYTVEATALDSRTLTLDQPFVIGESAEPNVWVEVVAPRFHRPGRPARATVDFGNTGTADAFNNYLTIYLPGVPDTSHVQIVTALDTTGLAGEELEVAPNPVVIDEATGLVSVPLWIPLLSAGSQESFELIITTSASAFSVEATIRPGSLTYAELVGDDKNIGAACAEAYQDMFLDVALDAAGIGGAPLASCFTTTLGLAEEAMRFVSDNPTARSTSSAIVAWTSIVEGSLSCAAVFTPVGGAVAIASTIVTISTQAPTMVLNYANHAENIGDKCGDDDGGSSSQQQVQQVVSMDPNEKVGPARILSSDYLQHGDPLPYRIYFENLAGATGAAQEVFITDVLDTTKVDLRTLTLGRMAFGTDHIIDPPPGLQEYIVDVDLRPEQDLICRIHAELIRSTGVLRWIFRSLDPATGALTEDPLAGFLPPNVESPEGEGYVSFRVEHKPTLLTDDAISNSASIVFDLNEPIVTNTWVNHIDDSPPESAVAELAEYSPWLFVVDWSGADAGSGIKHFDVYVSKDGGDYEPWQYRTTVTSAEFGGEDGATYRFFSVAHDVSGHVEHQPGIPDAETTVDETLATDDDSDEDTPSVAVPTRIEIWQNYPNPFNPSTTIRFGLPEDESVRLRVFDTRGRLVDTLVQESLPAGWHEVIWSPHRATSGVYFAQLQVDGKLMTTVRMTLLK